LSEPWGRWRYFFEEICGNSTAVGVTVFQVDVPEQQYYIYSQYWHQADGAELFQFHPRGIWKRVGMRRFVKVQLAKPLRRVLMSFIIRK